MYQDWFSASLKQFVDTYYSVESSNLAIYNRDIVLSLTGLQPAYLFSLGMSSTGIRTVYTRDSLLTFLATLGGLMYTLRNVSNGLNKKFSDFTIDNTMMRKLYSVRKQDDELFAANHCEQDRPKRNL